MYPVGIKSRHASPFAARGLKARAAKPAPGRASPAGTCADNARLPVKRLLVALGERVRLDQILGLVDQFELAIELGATDAGLRPEVMVFVDAHVTFRRALEFNTRRSSRALFDVEASGLSGG